MIPCQCVLSRSLVLALAVGSVACTPQHQPSDPSSGTETAKDDAAIRSHAAGFERALNSRDFAAFSEQFTPDGDLILVDGPLTSGREAIRRSIQAAWTDAPPTRRASITVNNIRFLSSDIALVEAAARFSAGEPAQDRGTSVVVRRDGVWRTLALRVLPVAAP
jgi:uncharacterized protein (TIGR02246 family)